jgi:branched-chain amino acid transport system ATP-binding protein
VLEVEGASAGYGNLHILTDVSIRAEAKEVTVVVGPNGSGKSTLLKTIAGITNLYQGNIKLDGKSISHLPPHEIARLGLAYLPQTESVFTQLSVSENIRMAGYTVAPNEFDGRVREVVAMFPQIDRYMKTKVQNLSGGERQMVAMSMALLRKPSVIMFDEPTANLSPKLATQVLNTVRSVAKDQSSWSSRTPSGPLTWETGRTSSSVGGGCTRGEQGSCSLTPSWPKCISA